MSIPAEIVLTIAGLPLIIGVLVSKVADRFGGPALMFILFSGGLRRFSKPIGLAWLDRFFTEHRQALPDRMIVDRSKISATKPW